MRELKCGDSVFFQDPQSGITYDARIVTVHESQAYVIRMCSECKRDYTLSIPIEWIIE